MKRVVLATVIVGAVALTARAQPARETPSAPAVQPRSIAGRVLADDTGDPVANARVALTTAVPGAVVLTDHEGRFTLTAPASRVSVAANKSGYSRREIPVGAADRPIEIRLLRGAAISGRVVDERGDPVMLVRIVAQPAAPGGPAAEAATETDDRGEYRLSGLQPGTFKLFAITFGPMRRQVVGGDQIIMTGEPVRVYFPGVTNESDAESLRLQPGDERSGGDFVVPSGQPMGQMMMSGPAPRPSATAADSRQSGVIRGRVVGTDGRAIARALVRLVAIKTFQPTTATADDDGRFEFLDLPRGSFRVGAAKVGYSPPDVPTTFALPGFNSGVSLDLMEGETRERVDLTLAKWGAMSGHVFDELGDPVQSASVQLLQVRYQGGRRRLVGAGGTSLGTDDLGRFRIFGLTPGQYIVSAIVGGVATVDLPGYTRSYYPGTPNASEAQFVSLGLSQETTGIDFSLSRTRTARIAGTLLNAAGEPSTGGSVKLLPSQRSNAVTSVSVGARILPDGRFEFPNVAPGQYVIQVDRGRRNSSTEGEFGVLPVSVDGVDVTDLVLQTSTGSSIAGRVTFDSFLGAKAPRPGEVEITPVPTDPDLSPAAPANADIHADWSFEIRGVNGPRRLQLQRAPAEWTLREIRVNGIDVTDRPMAFGKADQSLTDVEVALTDRINTVSATIVDDRARPAPGAHLVVFSIDRDRWYATSRYLRHAITGDDGAVAIAGLPPGSYYATVLAQIPIDGPDAWQEPAFLESLVPRASAFAFDEGQTQALHLKLTER